VQQPIFSSSLKQAEVQKNNNKPFFQLLLFFVREIAAILMAGYSLGKAFWAVIPFETKYPTST